MKTYKHWPRVRRITYEWSPEGAATSEFDEMALPHMIEMQAYRDCLVHAETLHRLLSKSVKALKEIRVTDALDKALEPYEISLRLFEAFKEEIGLEE